MLARGVPEGRAVWIGISVGELAAAETSPLLWSADKKIPGAPLQAHPGLLSTYAGRW